MREERHARSTLEDVFFVALEDTEREEAVDGDFVGLKVDIVPHNALFEHLGADVLHFQDDVVDCSALRAEFAGDGEGACLMGSVSYWGEAERVLCYSMHQMKRPTISEA